MSHFNILNGDCLDHLRSLPDSSVDSVVTDPPYGLSGIPSIEQVLQCWLNDQPYRHNQGGFMGHAWDSFVPGPEVWRECWRVLKPGGHLLSFFATRTYDIGTLAIRLANFEIRDTIMWVYGSGMSKSMNVEKAIQKHLEKHAPLDDNLDPDEVAQEWSGWGTGLKPAVEPIAVARKPLEGTVAATVLKHGTGAINIEECRVQPTGESRERQGEKSQDLRYQDRGNTNFSFKPGIRGGHPNGRIPANLIHDGSEEVLRAFPEAPGQQGKASSNPDSPRTRKVYGKYKRADEPMIPRGDQGTAARFFYCAKASRKDKNEGLVGLDNHHVAVKPTTLMRYLCRLVTPPGGVVLDPYMGSGSTGKAALLEGFSFIGIEQDEGYAQVADQRLRNALAKAQAA